MARIALQTTVNGSKGAYTHGGEPVRTAGLDLFAAISEGGDGEISLMGTWNSREEMEAACSSSSKPHSPIFAKYPPSGEDIEQASDDEFTGRVVYGNIELDETFGNAVQFMLSYETEGASSQGIAKGLIKWWRTFSENILEIDLK